MLALRACRPQLTRSCASRARCAPCWHLESTRPVQLQTKLQLLPTWNAELRMHAHISSHVRRISNPDWPAWRSWRVPLRAMVELAIVAVACAIAAQMTKKSATSCCCERCSLRWGVLCGSAFLVPLRTPSPTPHAYAHAIQRRHMRQTSPKQHYLTGLDSESDAGAVQRGAGMLCPGNGHPPLGERAAGTR